MTRTRQAAGSKAKLAQRLHSVAIRLLRRARRDDTAMGLPPAQTSSLLVLVFGGPKTMSELAAIEQVQAPTMTRIVEALVQAGRVRRKRDSIDRRKLLIEATSAGVNVMHEGQLRRVRVVTEFLSALSKAECATVEAAVTLLERQS